MGIPELDLMFDVLDTGITGYLTPSQLLEFFEEIYFTPLDRSQIEGALMTVCGHNHDNRCQREHFLAVLQELERRKSLEDKILWDFKALDFDGKNRISVESTLFLFKVVHEDNFSLKTWNSFIKQRPDPTSDVSFDEVKIFLCNIPAGGPCDEDEFLREKDDLGSRSCQEGFKTVKELLDLQADDASLAAEERERQDKANKLKHEAGRRTRRLDHEGVEALLHDNEEWDEEAARKARQRVTASELIHALKKKYEHIRETLLREMLKNHIGEGMWTAHSAQEQNERIGQLAVKVKKLRKEGKLDASTASTLPGAGEMFALNMMALMGNSRVEARRLHREEEKLRELMKEKGKSDLEIEVALKSLREESLKGTMTTDMMLLELERRYADEKDWLSRQLRGSDGHTMGIEERLVEYALLLREELRAKQESQFISAGYSVGLAEEMNHNLTGQDCIRQEKLALQRLAQRKGRKLQRDVLSDETLSKGDLGVVDLVEDVVKLVERKQAIEREVLIYMLQGRDSAKSRSYARKLTADERSNQLLVLKMQRQAWKDRSSADKLSSQDHHRAILQETVGLVFENRRNEMKELSGTTVDEIQVAAAILSELQECQDVESRLLSSFPNKDLQELRRLRTEEDQSIDEEWLDNLSAVLLGTEEGRGQEDELLKALEDKYDALRDKLLLEALEKQLGAAEWARLSEQERQARLLKLKLQEKRLRQQGKFDEAAALLGEGLKNAELLQSLLGENRQRFLDRLKERLARRQKRMEEGLDPDEEDEATMRMLEEEEAKSSGNILKDLQNRFDDEKDALLRRLREEQDRLLAEKRRQAELARLRREKRQAELESKFGSAALVLGLAERNRQSLEERLKQDRERQEQLARERLANRKGKRGKTDEEPDEPEPDKDDISGWQDAVLKAAERKHRSEQDVLMGLLLDDTSEDLRQEARDAGEDSRLKQIQELKVKRDELDFGVKADQETHEDILDMAAAYRVEIRRCKMASERETEIIDDVVHTSLMADLQEEQDKEIESIMSTLQDKSQPELVKLRQAHIQARKDVVAENVATILLRYEGLGTDGQILKALDNKYDALKDKLLLEALKKQLGDAEWANLSERERQQRLVKLKLEERRLREEGKMDDLARLLGEGLAMDANLRKLMGDNKARYEEKLKERLARRRERLAQGLPPDDNDEEDDGDDSEEVTNVIDVLNALDKRYDEERDALMGKLRGDNERFLSERQRQSELARLRREKIKAKQEDKFDSAALVLGLAERNQASAAERLNQDRLRQEQLARERLAQRRKRQSDGPPVEDKVITDGDITSMQENLLKILENKYKHEREVLSDLLQDEQKDLETTVEAWTQEQREERLRELKEKLLAVDDADTGQRKAILLEATAVKLVNRQAHLQKSRQEDGTIPRDDVIISLLADLQQEQDKESEVVIATMQDKDKKDVVELQKHHIEARQIETLKNVVTIVTRPEEVSEANDGELVQALEDKYDALRDKMIADALLKQVGESEWKAMSERDRMSKLVQMKLEAKRLRKEGKIDELQKIFGDSLANEANLATLMGENKASYDKRLQERLAKRRERVETGLDEQEVDRLEAEEDKHFEEEIQKASTGNALLDLEKRFEEEKEALLADLQGADQRFSSERERQAELARLKRDERRARQEDTFDKAAMVFGLAQAMQSNLSEVRKRDQERQKMLARQRLEARRSRTQSDLDKEKLKLKDAEQEDSVTDPTNIAALQEAVVKEMELKHACERQVFEIMLSEEKTSEMRIATRGLTLEQMNDRLSELKELRKQWREYSPDEMAETADEEELHLREATGLRIEIKMAESKQEGGEVAENLEEEISVSLLAELQQQQDQEQEFLLKDLASKLPITLQQIQQVHSMARKQKWYDNIAATLLGVKKTPTSSSTTSENDLVEALEEKYDALKDKLFAEALMKQMGETEWAAMSERERQARLVKLKIQEKRMREEGKLDEASRLFGEGQKHEASLRNLMGQSKARQQDAIRERLSKLKNMKEAGEVVNEEELTTLELIDERGIESVDSAVLEKISEQLATDGEQVTTANLIHDLQSRYEEEKEALLASLRGQDARLQSERMRQLELAKLRREQKRFKVQDTFDTAAILLGLAKKQEAIRDSNFKEDRSRQEQLARERIAALKARRAASKNKTTNEETEKNELTDAIIKEILSDMESDKLQSVQISQGGITALQEAILNELEQKHTSEHQVLTDLLQGVEEDPEGIAAARYLLSDERQAKIDQIGKERQSWRMDSMRDALRSVPESQQNEDERQIYASRIVDSRSCQKKLLHDALLLRTESRRQLLVEQGVAEEKINDEVAVGLLADLQEKQQSENSAMNGVLADKEKEVLDQIKEDQRRARREGWCDNVAGTVLGARPVRKRSTTMKSSSGMDVLGEEEEEEHAQMEEDHEKQLEALEEEMEEEKKAKKLAGASEEEINSAMAKLQQQHDAKRTAMQQDIERQRRMTRERLEARRRKREEQQYEEDVAASIITMAEKQFAMVREKTMLRRGEAKDSLKDRLAKRRLERQQKKAEEEEQERKEEEEKEKQKRAQDGKKADGTTSEWPLPAGFSMKREKTVIEVDLSEEKQREIVSSLIREHTSLGKKFERERTRQEDMLKRRRHKKKEKREQKEEEAMFILGLGERQKTFVEQQQKDERERQITMIRDRITRVRYERTQTMREPRDPSEPKGFSSFQDDKEMEGLSQDEKMKRIAAKMEEKFKSEQKRKSSVQVLSPPVLSPDGSSVETSEDENREVSHNLLDEKSREKKLKERMASRRRKSRQHNEPVILPVEGAEGGS